ncbi:hypothetical protein AND4_05319 [Vibrio sp. AND4]|nr:hypothetical protein AND4_05319 [Vibrio sp. AND4]
MSKIDPSALKPKFMAGAVPQQEDFAQLIDLAGQVREVNYGNGLNLNNGTLNINYGTVSTKLAGEGLTGSGDTLKVNYGAVSSKLAGEGLTGTGDTLKVNYGTVSTKLAGEGLTDNGDTLKVNYGTVSTKLAGEGLTGSGDTLGIDYIQIWKRLMARTHSATHFAKHSDTAGFIFFHTSRSGWTRAYLYNTDSAWVGVITTGGHLVLKLDGKSPTRTVGEFNDYDLDDPIKIAEWRNQTITDNSKIEVKWWMTDWTFTRKSWKVYPISQL